jgi:hypothetical protein
MAEKTKEQLAAEAAAKPIAVPSQPAADNTVVPVATAPIAAASVVPSVPSKQLVVEKTATDEATNQRVAAGQPIVPSQVSVVGADAVKKYPSDVTKNDVVMKGVQVNPSGELVDTSAYTQKENLGKTVGAFVPDFIKPANAASVEPQQVQPQKTNDDPNSTWYRKMGEGISRDLTATDEMARIERGKLSEDVQAIKGTIGTIVDPNYRPPEQETIKTPTGAEFIKTGDDSYMQAKKGTAITPSTTPPPPVADATVKSDAQPEAKLEVTATAEKTATPTALVAKVGAPAMKQMDNIATSEPVFKGTDAVGNVSYSDRQMTAKPQSAEKRAEMERVYASNPEFAKTDMYAGGNSGSSDMAAIQAARPKGTSSSGTFAEEKTSQGNNANNGEAYAQDESTGGAISQAVGVKSDALYRNETAQRMAGDIESDIKVRDAATAVAEGRYPVHNKVTNDRSKIPSSAPEQSTSIARVGYEDVARPTVNTVVPTAATPSPVSATQASLTTNAAAQPNSTGGTVSTTSSDNQDTYSTINNGRDYKPTAFAPPQPEQTAQVGAMPQQPAYNATAYKSNVLPDRAANEAMQRNIDTANAAIQAGISDPSNAIARNAAKFGERYLKQLQDYDIQGNISPQLKQQDLAQQDLQQRRAGTVESWKTLLANENAGKARAQSGAEFEQSKAQQAAQFGQSKAQQAEQFGQSQNLAERRLAMESRPRAGKLVSEDIIDAAGDPTGAKRLVDDITGVPIEETRAQQKAQQVNQQSQMAALEQSAKDGNPDSIKLLERLKARNAK